MLRRLRPLRTIAAGLLVLAAPISAEAHPHVFVDARAQIVFDGAGAITAIRNIWTFDEAFSAYAKQGLKRLANGRLTPESLEALARVNIHSLALYKFFTFQRRAGKLEPVGVGDQQKLSDDGERLTLTFTVTPSQPINPAEGPLTFELYDPEYFVAMSFVKDRPVSLVGAPAGCKQSLFTPTGLTPAAAALIARVPASQRNLPPELEAMTGGIENGVVIDCSPAAAAEAAPAAKATGAARTPSSSGD